MEANSRASLLLTNGITLRLGAGTVLSLNGLVPDKPTLLELFKGFVHFISRTPKRLQINTPIANAGPEGTEFAMSVDDNNASLWVYEGGVKFFNDKGSVRLSPGQGGQAQKGQAPQAHIDIKPKDAVNWALYYPPILPYPDAATNIDSDIRTAVQDFRQGRSNAALSRLNRLPPAQQTPYFHKVRGAILLSVGQDKLALQDIHTLLAHNPNDAEALALQSVIALTQNRKDEAYTLANRAVSTNPQSATAYSALSYAEQGRFQLDKAQSAANQATKLAPHDAMVWARKAELELAQGLTSQSQETAERALVLDANLERTQTVTGFTYLLRMDTDEALHSFKKAIELDSSSPLARLGLGLAKIRDGDLAEGRQDLEIATILDPNNALIRSYLGKAYYEERRNPLAEDQFNLAKERDPKDPTPYFYDAIRKQTSNRPVEALHDMQKAIALNDNRAVYRSSLLLDKDIAARGAALGRIYNELGFSQRGLVEGWRGLAQDPTDYTSHRLLSDSYSTLPRHDLAHASELLQSQMLQPINITPVQPRLAESQLFLLGGLGPSALSLNEFNPLFERNRFSLLTSGLVGSNNTYSDEVVHSGLWDNFSYSLGQFHYQTDGFRRNNDIDVNIYNAFVQGRITADLNVQAEYRHREVERGNLESFFSAPVGSPQDDFVNTFRRRSESDTYRFGTHWSPTKQSDFLGSFIHIDQFTAFGFDKSDLNVARNRANIGEVQYIHRLGSIKSILGGGYSHLDTTESISQSGNGYLYTHILYPSNIDWTLGISYNELDDTKFLKHLNTINPKFGLLWNLSSNTVFRAALFRTVNGSKLSYQTLEPVQVAGFNQIYDDDYRTEALRWGIGLDHKFNSILSGGIEISRRYLDIHNILENDENITIGENVDHWRESNYRAYLLWSPHPRWTGTLEYFRENFNNVGEFSPLDTETQVIPIGLSYFDPNGLFVKFKSSFYNQSVNLDGEHPSDNTVFLDLSLGYRLPERRGLIEVQFQNLLDQNYRYEGLQDRQPTDTGGVPPFMPFSPEFTVFARLTLAL